MECLSKNKKKFCYFNYFINNFISYWNDEKSIRYLEMTLCLHGNDEETKKFLVSMKSWSVEINFWIHLIANK